MSNSNHNLEKWRFVDTHCHLNSLKSLSLNETLQRCQEAGVEKLVTIATGPDDLDAVIDLAKQNEQVFCTQGVHPHEALLFDGNVMAKIRMNAKENDKVLALGEMGLDYYYQHSPQDKQREVFEKQLQLAVDLNLPVVIHTRQADEDTLQILGNFSRQMKRKGVLHSFTSGRKLAEWALQEGFYLGLNGIVTFKNAEEVRDIVRTTPPSQILFETDAPYLTPVPYRGKENNPFYLPFVAHKMAEILGLTLEELSELVYQNSCRFFSFPSS